ncbi:MAG: GNAT family N-acetyltransferase [Ardenticatenaceae bacterium]
MTQVNPFYVPLPYQDRADAGRLILRDGSTASIRIANPSDVDGLHAFFEQLSEYSRYTRFFSPRVPTKKFMASFCRDDDPESLLTLIVTRVVEGVSSIVATASYLAMDESRAEVAFTVDDEFQGKGLGTLLLERLAVLAAQHGITSFFALTMSENRAMVELLRRSGFDIEAQRAGSEVEIDLSVVPTEKSVARSQMRDRVATVASLRPFFHPNAVAVIGASSKAKSIGYRLMSALISGHFQGAVYPVNIKGGVIHSIRASKSIKELPERPDLAIIAVPRHVVLDVVDECAEQGVRALIVITAGFSEANAEGRALQEQLVEKVRGYGMRMVGPNCLGLLNSDPTVRLNASFSPHFSPPGSVAMASQSGALGLAVLGLTEQLDLGLSTFVSLGNKADVSGNDLIQYWEEDEHTNVILLYLESFGNPRRFVRLAQRVSRRKPIVIVKSGRTQAGRRAAGSHTASLAGSDVAVEALVRQSGIIRAQTLDEMFHLAQGLSNQPLPRGNRVAIVTNAGGPGILCADVCEAGGLLLPELSPQTQAELATFLPPAASLKNPVDMIASATPEQYQRTIETIMASDDMDALIVIYIPIGVTDDDAIEAAIQAGVTNSRLNGATNQPVMLCWMAGDAHKAPLALLTRSNDFSRSAPGTTKVVTTSEKVPTYAYPEAAGRVLSKMAAYAAWREQPAGMYLDFEQIQPQVAREICQQALQTRGAGWLTTEEARAVLAALRLPISPGGVAHTPDDAVKLAQQVGFPVAVKLASTKIVHKTEIQGVQLNLKDEHAVRNAFEHIRQQVERTLEGADEQVAHTSEAHATSGASLEEVMEGVLVQPMVASGTEVMIGVSQEAGFGSLIAFGLGGIHVEILRDVRFGLTPLTDRDAKEMIRGIRGYRLLQGYRGLPAADIPALEDTLLRISRLVEEVPHIKELDLNPVFALPQGKGCRIVDARIWVAEA